MKLRTGEKRSGVRFGMSGKNSNGADPGLAGPEFCWIDRLDHTYLRYTKNHHREPTNIQPLSAASAYSDRLFIIISKSFTIHIVHLIQVAD